MSAYHLNASCYNESAIKHKLCCTSPILNTMATNKQHSYIISYKLKVMDYAKEHGNRTAARIFGPPPTEKTVGAWRQQEDELKTTIKSKHNLRCPCPQWPELEDDVKKLVVDERSSGICVSMKMILNEARRVAEE